MVRETRRAKRDEGEQKWGSPVSRGRKPQDCERPGLASGVTTTRPRLLINAHTTRTTSTTPTWNTTPLLTSCGKSPQIFTSDPIGLHIPRMLIGGPLGSVVSSMRNDCRISSSIIGTHQVSSSQMNIGSGATRASGGR